MEENQSLLDLQVDKEAASNLLEVSRWAKFLGVLVVTGFALVFVMFIVLWSRIETLFLLNEKITASESSLMRITAIITYTIAASIFIILVSFLIRGANRIRKGIQNRDQLLFNNGLASFKNFFIMYGVLAIIGLFFVLLSLLVSK